MNQLNITPSKIPLLSYEMEGPNSQRNMSSIEFINYYKEPFYKETGGLITEMYIRTFNFGDSYLGMNYDPERMTEELAKASIYKIHIPPMDHAWGINLLSHCYHKIIISLFSKNI